MPKNTDAGSAHTAARQHNQEWVERQACSPEARRLYEQERLIAWVFELLSETMESTGKSKADLAQVLGTSRSHITQLFSGQRNATLRTLADLAWACDRRLAMAVEPLRYGEYIDTPVCLVQPARPRVQLPAAGEDDEQEQSAEQTGLQLLAA